MVKILYSCAIILALAACGGDKQEAKAQSRDNVTPAKEFFGAKKVASDQRPMPHGGYARGCVAGAEQLPETGPTWQAMRLSRNRNWGHPETVDYIKDLSRKVSRLPNWEGLYVGDISQPRGGPMLTGHASHQIGMDADIWMLNPKRLDLSPGERERISSISLRRSSGAYTNDNWTDQHMQVLKMAASDPRVARIFVFPGAKVRMCNEARGDRAWLNKIRPWWGHHYHFHVRLKCPANAKNCKNQAPPPAGDGCDAAQGWVDRILNPPPPDPNAKPRPKKKAITLATLPAQCSGVLKSN